MFCKNYDHGRSLNKDSKTRHFCEDCNHNRSHNKEECDHGRNPLDISSAHFQSGPFLFKVITADYLHLSLLSNAFALDM